MHELKFLEHAHDWVRADPEFLSHLIIPLNAADILVVDYLGLNHHYTSRK